VRITSGQTDAGPLPWWLRVVNAKSYNLQARLSAAEELAKRSTSLQAEVSTLKQQLDEVRSNSDRVILEQVRKWRESSINRSSKQ
jgi:uncharacterized protein YigA (DUF484 family)